ncbi:MAG: hypothetical protein AMXMBFR36_27910 [Acidobacteriota bacterium]
MIVVVVSTATTVVALVTSVLGIEAWPPVFFAAGGVLLFAGYFVLASRIISNAESHSAELSALRSELRDLRASHEDEALRARWEREFGEGLTALTGRELLNRAGAELERLDNLAMSGGARERRRFDEFAKTFLALYAKTFGTSGRHFADQHGRIEEMSQRHRLVSLGDSDAERED